MNKKYLYYIKASEYYKHSAKSKGNILKQSSKNIQAKDYFDFILDYSIDPVEYKIDLSNLIKQYYDSIDISPDAIQKGLIDQYCKKLPFYFKDLMRMIMSVWWVRDIRESVLNDMDLRYRDIQILKKYYYDNNIYADKHWNDLTNIKSEQIQLSDLYYSEHEKYLDHMRQMEGQEFMHEFNTLMTEDLLARHMKNSIYKNIEEFIISCCPTTNIRLNQLKIQYN